MTLVVRKSVVGLEICENLCNLWMKNMLPKIFAILNTTPDSFFDGDPEQTPQDVLRQAAARLEEGADVLDFGGQSTRPGHVAVSPETEAGRVIPALRLAHQEFPDAVLSIDTYQPEVARAAVEAGASIINDVSGLRDPAMRRLVAETSCRAVLMHDDPGLPGCSGDVVVAVAEWLMRAVAEAVEDGVAPVRLILDPGIGFHKTLEQNVALVNRLGELRERTGFPLLLGHSRKSFIGELLGLPKPADRLEGTLAVSVLAARQGVDYLRVHDVAANLRALHGGQLTISN
jgi:dihydropteroate synthase